MNIFRRIAAKLKRKPVVEDGNLFRIMNMAWIAQCVYAATELGVADHLDDGPKSCEQLADLARSHRRSFAS